MMSLGFVDGLVAAGNNGSALRRLSDLNNDQAFREFFGYELAPQASDFEATSDSASDAPPPLPGTCRSIAVSGGADHGSYEAGVILGLTEKLSTETQW